LFPVLLIGYRRYANLEILIELALSAGVSRIYVALDGPANKDAENDSKKCLELIEKYTNRYPSLIKLKRSPTNIGLGVSVITACDWFFENESFGAILEDDCIPQSDFFDWVSDARNLIESDSDFFMVSGSQFFQSNNPDPGMYSVSFPVIWGWATSSSKWKIMSDFISQGEIPKYFRSRMGFLDYIYWSSGTRRVFDGYIDTWDIPLAFYFQRDKLKCLLPPVNLVSNIGIEAFSTHTKNLCENLSVPTGKYSKKLDAIAEIRDISAWYRKNIYKIRIRHIVTTQVNRLFDLLGLNKKKRETLKIRLDLCSE
jgi:hypothetical protein